MLSVHNGCTSYNSLHHLCWTDWQKRGMDGHTQKNLSRFYLESVLRFLVTYIGSSVNEKKGLHE